MYKRKAYKKKYKSKKKREKLYNREDGKINMYLTYGDGIIIKIKKRNLALVLITKNKNMHDVRDIKIFTIKEKLLI